MKRCYRKKFRKLRFSVDALEKAGVHTKLVRIGQVNGELILDFEKEITSTEIQKIQEVLEKNFFEEKDGVWVELPERPKIIEHDKK